MKKISGVVVARNNLKTAAVNVIHYKRHPKYKKVVRSSRKIQVHCEGFDPMIGEVVILEHSRPFSATKKFCVVEVKPNSKE